MQAKTTIEFSLEQIQEILAAYVSEKYPQCEVAGHSKTAVTFSVSSGYSDRMSSVGPHLNSASVKVALNSKAPSGTNSFGPG